MGKLVEFTLETDSEMKEQAEMVCAETGMIFDVRRDVLSVDPFYSESNMKHLQKSIMIEIKEQQPNELTLKAMEDAENGIGMSRPFNSVPELIAALNADDADEPNAETLAAFAEGERMLLDPDSPRFSSVAELFDDLEVEAATLVEVGEVEQMKNKSIGKSYADVDGMMAELLD